MLPIKKQPLNATKALPSSLLAAVLITNKVNIYREIENGNGGCIEEDTLEGTYNNLYNWLSLSTQEKEKMGSNAFTVYQDHFNIENAAKTYFQTMTASK